MVAGMIVHKAVSTMSNTELHEGDWPRNMSQAVADELHRRARRIVDKVVAEAMDNMRKHREIRNKIVFVGKKR